MRRGRATTVGKGLGKGLGLGLGLAGAALTAAAPARAECQRTIVNKSALVAVVSRDGGPGVAVPPHSAQPIHLFQPGRIDIALYCPHPAPGAPQAPVWSGSYGYSAIIDRCYYEFGDGFFEDQLGRGFIGVADTKPLTLNMPRQGDLVVGPVSDPRCAAVLPVEGVRARY